MKKPSPQRGITAKSAAASGIRRRDFLGGTLLSAGACALSPLELLASDSKSAAGYKSTAGYPPALTGLRGSHPGSFDVAHALAWRGETFPAPSSIDDQDYDLIVVGGGISGLAAAYFWRQEHGPDARILILDNHDDFGGHARRNEFTVDGRLMLGYGGSQSIDTPGSYSPAAAQLLRDLGIFTDRFYDYYDQQFWNKQKLSRGFWFSEEVYGRNVTAKGIQTWSRATEKLTQGDIAAYPIPEEARRGFFQLLNSDTNFLADIAPEKRREWLITHSYKEFLLSKAKMPEDVYFLLRDGMRGYGGVGQDAMPALWAQEQELPGTLYLDLPPLPESSAEEIDEPYIFHFPDGNASVARALVRDLIPGVLPPSTMEQLVLAKADYSALDRADNACRLRLKSTAIKVEHSAGEREVEVTYVRKGTPTMARGKHVVMACYNAMIPYLCPELPKAQREAITYAEKTPLVYVSAAFKNWEAFANLGMRDIKIPQPDMMHSFSMDFPVSMSDIEYPTDPSQPVFVHGSYIPCVPDSGLDNKEQYRRGRRELYQLSYDDFERRLLRQFDGALSPGGFDIERDLAGLTINRWPHGYAYEYNPLFDDPSFGVDKGPHIAGRAPIGRISIANSDSSAYAYVNGAIDAARRAVSEQAG
ncbi:NAD(P)/FAD-dependent oxidoreductase [Luminiphilus syltensis]|nr:NAD(P)/FAD-dependent oxidoreductase [Luminiphilus syltensis]